jgi:ribosomal protein S18 acetylase RimI-like enzyme
LKRSIPEFWIHTTTMKKLTFRQALNADINKILDLEHNCYEHPLEKIQIQRYIKNGIAFLVEEGKTPVGYIVYETSALTGKGTVEIYACGVKKSHRRKGIGTDLVGLAKSGDTKEVFVTLRERNLDGQLFLKSLSFKCIEQVKKHYKDSDELALVFRYLAPVPILEDIMV